MQEQTLYMALGQMLYLLFGLYLIIFPAVQHYRFSEDTQHMTNKAARFRKSRRVRF